MISTLKHQRQAWSVLIVSTLAFTVCFMVWMMFGVIGIPIRDNLGLNATEFGLLMATPILAGSLVRLPLGLWMDRHCGRRTMAALLVVAVPGIWALSLATEYWHFLLASLFAGLAGGTFAIGTPYVARWFPRHQQGMAMGVYGSGNVGAALNQIIAPTLLVAFGWHLVPQVYAVLMVMAVVVFWLFSSDEVESSQAAKMTLSEQFRILREPRVLRYCQYYSVVFGGFVALSLWLVQYYVGEYGLNIRMAALMAVFFTLPGTLARGLGGWLADRHGAHAVTWWVMWVSWICLFLLSYPPTDLVVQTDLGQISFHVGVSQHLFTALVCVLGIAWAFGRASIFKYISDDYPDQLGAVSGVVGMVGGLGGFVLPILFGVVLDLTGIRSSAFMLLYGLVCISLIWMHWSEVRGTDVMGRQNAQLHH